MTGSRRVEMLAAGEPGSVMRAARHLRSGQLVVFPTDTVYGIGAAIDHPEAVAMLYVAKGRPLDRPIPVLISDHEQVARLSSTHDPRLEALFDRFWPGALTVVLPAVSWLPGEIVRDTGSVGLRMPDHPVALALIRTAGGALATTSANRSGGVEARSAEEAAAALSDHVSCFLDDGPSPGGVPSTVVAVQNGQITTLRRGALDPHEVARAFHGRRP